MDVYDRIDRLITAKGLSRRKLAGLAGIAPATLNSAITRKAGLSPDTLTKIAAGLDVNVNELLYGRKMADEMKGIKSALASLSTSTRTLAHSILCRNFDLLNEPGQRRLLEDSDMYVKYPKYQNEEAIKQYNERRKNSPILEITLPDDTDDDYTQAEIDEYNEVLQRNEKKNTQQKDGE